MIPIQFDTLYGEGLDRRTWPIVPRVGEIVAFSHGRYRVAEVIWQSATRDDGTELDDLPEVIIGLCRIAAKSGEPKAESG